MADVRVGEKDPVRRPAGGQCVELCGEVGGGVDHISDTEVAVQKSDAADLLGAALAGVDVDARRFLATGVRHAAVLRDAENDELPAVTGLLR